MKDSSIPDNSCLRTAFAANKKAREHRVIRTLYILTSYKLKQRVISFRNVAQI